jgi:hypothetical protein
MRSPRHRRLLVSTGVLLLLGFAFAALIDRLSVADAAAPPACDRGRATVSGGDDVRGSVLVVRVDERPLDSESSRVAVYACWRPTGRRFLLRREHHFGLDGTEPTSTMVIDRRYVGVLALTLGSHSSWASAAVWDVRSGRRLHDTRACPPDPSVEDAASGVQSVVFLPGGGMAYACDQLRLADDHGDRQIAPPGSRAHNLAVSVDLWQQHRDRLLWFTGPDRESDADETIAGQEEAHSMGLPYQRRRQPR